MDYIINSSHQGTNILSDTAAMNIITLYPSAELLIEQNIQSCNIACLPPHLICELLEHCRSYTDTIFAAEHEQSIWLFVPSLYPASSAIPVFRLSPDTSVALKALKSQTACPVAYSKFITSKIGRKSPTTQAYTEQLSALLNTVTDTLLCLSVDMSNFSQPEQEKKLVQQCFRIAHLFNTKVDLNIDNSLRENTVSQTDLQLLTAFLYTVLLLSDKHTALTLGAMSGGAVAKISFSCPLRIAEKSLSFWEHTAYEKNMLFDITQKNDSFTVTFHPCRAELSLLGLKQNIAKQKETWQ